MRKIWANKFDQKSENEPKRSEKSDGELVNCPICSATMSASRINDHLDKECLTLDTRTEEKASKSSIKNPTKKSIKSPVQTKARAVIRKYKLQLRQLEFKRLKQIVPSIQNDATNDSDEVSKVI